MKTTESESNYVFSCAFGDGVTVTAVVDVNAVRSGQEDGEWIKVKFNGLWTPENMRMFRAWMLGVNQTVADVLETPVMWGFGWNKETCEIYHFYPGHPYRRVR